MESHVKALVEALCKPTHTCPWAQEDLASLATLCARADRIECGTPAPWLSSSDAQSDMERLSDFIGRFTPAGREKLLEEIQVHPIYRRVAEDVPRVVTAPAESPLDPLRRVWVIADNMVRPVPRKWHKTSSRPENKRREAELKAIRRLQQVTSSPLRKRKLAEWAEELKRPSPVAFRKLAHPALWWLAFHLWTRAHTADVQLLLQAGPLVDAACDDCTAGRYIKQAQKIVPGHQRLILPASPPPPATGLAGLLAGMPPPSANRDK